ncbi:MAG: hypothetical protein ABFS34_02680 [Gemmatimonadota bacterium]
MSPLPSSVRLHELAAIALLLLAGSARGALGQQADVNPHGEFAGDADCSACHTSDAWTPARSDPDFDHDDQTIFPITGSHADVECARCHIALRFAEPKLAGAECATCHVDVHRASLGPDCTSCHSTTSFAEVVGGEPHARTMFPLTGAHRVITCESCHVDDVGGAFGPLDLECTACHQEDYDRATFVDHQAGGFSTQCTDCHSLVAWREAPAFDHPSAANGYELVEAHGRLACESCHLRPGPGLRFAPADQNDCIACHQSDYDKEHAGDAFPTTCLDCHRQSDWDAEFDHREAGFDLVGAHTALSCESCHGPVDNALLFPSPAAQDDCVACHQDDYDARHTGSGFATACLDCHTVDTWGGASFDHDARFFPIFSGKHQPQWQTCEDCHTAPSDFSVFTCFTCHKHNQPDTDAQHENEGGYTYDSAACLECHPQGLT